MVDCGRRLRGRMTSTDVVHARYVPTTTMLSACVHRHSLKQPSFVPFDGVTWIIYAVIVRLR